MSTKPFFSLVIPCYNDGRYAPGQYIDRLLSNIVDQGLEKDEIEVIIADDHSPLPYDLTLDRYRDRLNIKYIVTSYNFAPGNTRQKGTTLAEGEWLCFADHDDMFYPGAFKAVKKIIEETGEKYFVYSDFNKVDAEDTSKVVEEFRSPHLSTWVHGKFYNLDNFWKPCKLQFIRDLRTHEDLALGTLVDCALHYLGDINGTYLKQPTYMWLHNKDSVSHGQYVAEVVEDGSKHEFFETHFNDYLISQIDAYLEAYKLGTITRDEAINMFLNKLCVAWFSNASFKVNNPENYLKENDAYCSRVWHRGKEELTLTVPAAKIIISKSFPQVKEKVDKTAEFYKLPDLFSWFNEIDEMDYQSTLDKILADRIRNGRAPISEGETMTHRPYFSVVIACYNDGRYQKGVYLDRLLASLTRQDIPREDLEVVLSDDCSPVPFDSIAAEYEDRLIIKRIKTDYNCCPGNTRAKGVTIATGEWLCFADHDDIYYDGALKIIQNAIIQKNEQHFAFGDFYGVSPEGEVKRKFECHLNWCHGKFYNRDNFWDKYGIHFIHDLKSHEDIAICTQVSCVLNSKLKNYTYVHKPIYAWTDNPQSVSHAKYTVDTEEGPREFLEVFFGDYLQSTGYIYIEEFKKHEIKITSAIKGALEIMCYAYFYTQGFQFRRPDDFYQKNLELSSDYVNLCKKTFNLTNNSIYEAVASNKAFMYYEIRSLADPGSGHYIPTQTFRQWLDLVSPDEEAK